MNLLERITHNTHVDFIVYFITFALPNKKNWEKQ